MTQKINTCKFAFTKFKMNSYTKSQCRILFADIISELKKEDASYEEVACMIMRTGECDELTNFSVMRRLLRNCKAHSETEDAFNDDWILWPNVNEIIKMSWYFQHNWQEIQRSAMRGLDISRGRLNLQKPAPRWIEQLTKYGGALHMLRCRHNWSDMKIMDECTVGIFPSKSPEQIEKELKQKYDLKIVRE